MFLCFTSILTTLFLPMPKRCSLSFFLDMYLPATFLSSTRKNVVPCLGNEQHSWTYLYCASNLSISHNFWYSLQIKASIYSTLEYSLDKTSVSVRNPGVCFELSNWPYWIWHWRAANEIASSLVQGLVPSIMAFRDLKGLYVRSRHGKIQHNVFTNTFWCN